MAISLQSGNGAEVIISVDEQAVGTVYPSLEGGKATWVFMYGTYPVIRKTYSNKVEAVKGALQHFAPKGTWRLYVYPTGHKIWKTIAATERRDGFQPIFEWAHSVPNSNDWRVQVSQQIEPAIPAPPRPEVKVVFDEEDPTICNVLADGVVIVQLRPEDARWAVRVLFQDGQDVALLPPPGVELG